MDDVMELLARTDPVTRDPGWPTSDEGRRVMEAALRTEPGVDPDASEPSRRQRVAFYVAAAAAVVVLALAAVAFVGADDRADTASEGSAGGTYAPGVPWIERVPDPPPGFELIDRGIAPVGATSADVGPDPNALLGHSYELVDGDRWVSLVLVDSSSEGPPLRDIELPTGPDSVSGPPRPVEEAGVMLHLMETADGLRFIYWSAADGNSAVLVGEAAHLDPALAVDLLESVGVVVER
jgi:hypothetical protein